MKKLEELGISPAPWFVDADGEIGCHYVSHAIRPNERRMRIVAKPNYNFDEHKADARFIAVAPQLYDRAYRVLAECDRIMDHDGGMAVIRACSADRLECAMTELREALAEAAGEVSDGK